MSNRTLPCRNTVSKTGLLTQTVLGFMYLLQLDQKRPKNPTLHFHRNFISRFGLKLSLSQTQLTDYCPHG